MRRGDGGDTEEGEPAARRGRHRRWVISVGALVLLVLSVAPAWRHWRAAGLLMELQRAGDEAAEPWWGMHEVEERDEAYRVGGEERPGRVYWPRGEQVEGGDRLVLVHGVHWRGMDEPRLQAFARSLAATGLSVFTPEITGLTRYEIDEDSTAAIAAAARHFAPASGSVGVMGISFGGGLALVAASRPEYREAISFVVSVGAHHDLSRVVSWYAGEAVASPAGDAPVVDPHPYGPAVATYRHLDHFVDASEVDVASSILRDYLHDDGAAARSRLGELSPGTRETLSAVLQNPPADAWRHRLLAVIAEDSDMSQRVSPSATLADIRVPVFLVHGLGDPIIPATETYWLAHDTPERYLEALVVTPLLRHAEAAGSPSLSEQWELVSFMAAVLAVAESGAD